MNNKKWYQKTWFWVVAILVILALISDDDSTSSSTVVSSSSDNVFTSSKFADFGRDPSRGELGVSKGDDICVEVIVETQGTAREVYTGYEYTYYRENCWTDPNRSLRVEFYFDDKSSLKQKVGKKIRICGNVMSVDIKKPGHACDHAYARIFLQDVDIKELN
jgi:hypothetical protein